MFQKERELSKFIKENPWIIEEGLTFLGEEVNIGFEEGGRIDLLFKNQKKQMWVVELKNGVINSSAVSQLVKYVGFISQKNNLSRENINMVLIGRKATTEVRTFCSLVGIRLVEFGLIDELRDKIEDYIKNVTNFQKTEKVECVAKTTNLQTKYKVVRIQNVSAIASGAVMEMNPNDLLCRLFTPKRVQLITELMRHKPSSIGELASTLNRDIKNVFDDLTLLQDADIIDLVSEGRRKVPTIKRKSLVIRFG